MTDGVSSIALLLLYLTVGVSLHAGSRPSHLRAYDVLRHVLLVVRLNARVSNKDSYRVMIREDMGSGSYI